MAGACPNRSSSPHPLLRTPACGGSVFPCSGQNRIPPPSTDASGASLVRQNTAPIAKSRTIVKNKKRTFLGCSRSGLKRLLPVITGLVPVISFLRGTALLIIGMAGTSPAMTREAAPLSNA
ncbi:hypothetical protein DC522_07870 [Microvirga sp. KLBC 81]|nr:hypothetical protein DC522_07870 [Microvirga sp. KLBC 81]